jgi:hypothetical protein
MECRNMKYIEIGLNEEGILLFARVDDDGLIRYTCFQEDSAYQAWLNPTETVMTQIEGVN